jgi:hypothetical protein
VIEQGLCFIRAYRVGYRWQLFFVLRYLIRRYPLRRAIQQGQQALLNVADPGVNIAD